LHFYLITLLCYQNQTQNAQKTNKNKKIDIMIVSKFGGTSLADSNQVRKVMEIIHSNPQRQYIVVSAPGEGAFGEEKITDTLYGWYGLRKRGLSSAHKESTFCKRFAEIVDAMKLNDRINIQEEYTSILKRLDLGASEDYLVSRGEYLMGKILAAALDFTFIDPMTCIRIDRRGRYNKHKQESRIRTCLQELKVVIPGFYGCTEDGSIKTFSRGGSDLTGALVAEAMDAKLYENWTDVSGIRRVDPRIIKDAELIETICDSELRELTYMGAKVFHEEAMFPLRQSRIPIRILNTMKPEDPGTLIVVDEKYPSDKRDVVGIAGRQNFTIITIKKDMMNEERGYARRILSILEKNDVSFEHMPSGIDTISLIIDGKQLDDGKTKKIVEEIEDECPPTTVEVGQNITMIAVVGRGMVHNPGSAEKIFSALADARINVRIINQGSSELSILIGIADIDYEKAIKALYEKLFP
jgi:aspartate kinase